MNFIKPLIVIYFSFLFFGVNQLMAQSSQMALLEDSLIALHSKMAEAKTDIARNQCNNNFKSLLLQTIKQPLSNSYPFQKLRISILEPEDHSFRIFNWNLPNDDLTNQYYCLVSIYKKGAKENTIIELTDKSALELENIQTVYTETNWYGALYYQLVPIGKKNNRTYIILGWDGNNALSTKKVIETITVSKKGVKLGSSIFLSNKKTDKRVIFEFAKETNVLLRYYPEFKSIVFNHLVPLRGQLEGNNSYYVPDLTFDAYQLEGSKWVLKKNIEFNSPNKPENNFEKPTPPNLNNKREEINPLTGEPNVK